MLVAAPGQLYAVSRLATDPHGQAMSERAKAYLPNQGLVEETHLIQSDLVVAGSFSSRATIDMLERLDSPVTKFEPAYSLGDVRDRLLKMGGALGQTDHEGGDPSWLGARGAQFLVCLHGLGLAARHCTRLILLSEGGIVADGLPAEVLTLDRMAQVFGINAFYRESEHDPVFQPLDVIS